MQLQHAKDVRACWTLLRDILRGHTEIDEDAPPISNISNTIHTGSSSPRALLLPFSFAIVPSPFESSKLPRLASINHVTTCSRSTPVPRLTSGPSTGPIILTGEDEDVCRSEDGRSKLTDIDSFENVRCRSAEREPNVGQPTLDAGAMMEGVD